MVSSQDRARMAHTLTAQRALWPRGWRLPLLYPQIDICREDCDHDICLGLDEYEGCRWSRSWRECLAVEVLEDVCQIIGSGRRVFISILSVATSLDPFTYCNKREQMKEASMLYLVSITSGASFSRHGVGARQRGLTPRQL